ncbi:hypothetical protein [Actinomadura macrotermitis]|uniref:Uncharacterized protein n=1 Tax=Actinomadura macrotermitis TaxID=2585200 RepID=A0A7K0BZK9_9ACTN|nr:hypothetical protein [Actinomadura macrotermitis]MQY06620.1 hypothetical protein [Actinomadura macrotermitis]
MTDPMTIAIATAAAGKAVELAGEPAREAMAALVRRFKERFRGRPEDEQALERAAEDPGSPERLEVLEGVIRRSLEEDPAFRDQVEDLWGRARNDVRAGGNSNLNNVNAHGDLGKSVQIRDVRGGVHL